MSLLPVFFSSLHAFTTNVGQGLVIIERLACNLLNVFEVFDSHLCHGYGNLDAIEFVQMYFTIFEADKLSFHFERC